MKNILKFTGILFLFITTSCAQAQDEKMVEASIKALEKGLIEGDYNTFKNYLSMDFKAGSYPASVSDQVLPQVLSQYPKLKSLQVLEIKDNVAEIEYEFTDGKEVSTVSFDDKGKIKNIQFIDDVLVVSEVAQSTSAFSTITSFTTPFNLVGGLIFVKAKLNGKEENFIIDSGAPVMVLNTAHFDNGTNNGEAMGVSGSTATQSVPIKNFDWNGMNVSDTEVLGMDLSHLEEATGEKFAGLIGHSLLQDYELLIDYKKKKLLLFSPGETKYHTEVKPSQIIPFNYEAHIPVIQAKINDVDYKLGLDTGAEANLLDIPDFEKLDKSSYKLLGNGELSGADKGIKDVSSFEIKNTIISDSKFENMDFISSDISHLNNGYGLQLNGLLGFPFLSNGKVSINFFEQKINFWE